MGITVLPSFFLLLRTRYGRGKIPNSFGYGRLKLFYLVGLTMELLFTVVVLTTVSFETIGASGAAVTSGVSLVLPSGDSFPVENFDFCVALF